MTAAGRLAWGGCCRAIWVALDWRLDSVLEEDS